MKTCIELLVEAAQAVVDGAQKLPPHNLVACIDPNLVSELQAALTKMKEEQVPTPDCEVNQLSSGMCEYGVKGCTAEHDPEAHLGPFGRKLFNLAHNPNIPRLCRACTSPLLCEHLFVDDGCPCNSPRGVNFTPQPCVICKTDDCVKPGHHLADIFGDFVTDVLRALHEETKKPHG